MEADADATADKVVDADVDVGVDDEAATPAPDAAVTDAALKGIGDVRLMIVIGGGGGRCVSVLFLRNVKPECRRRQRITGCRGIRAS